MALEDHREAILRTLRGPRPCDEDAAIWQRLDDATARIGWEKYLEPPTASQRKQHHQKTAGALKVATATLRATMSDPYLRDDLTVSLTACGLEEGYAEGFVIDMLNMLTAGTAAAERAVNDVTVRRGRPDGTSLISTYVILCLKPVYEDATGLKAGQPGHKKGVGPDGPFYRFVDAVITAMGIPINEDTLAGVIKKALTDGKRAKAKAERRKAKYVAH